MTKNTTQTAVPKLRFPEFRGAEGWATETFEKIYSFQATNTLSRDSLNYAEGAVKNIHYGDIHTKFSALFDVTKEYVPFINPSISLEKVKPESYCVEGDVIFADASEDLNDVGKSIEVVKLNGEKVVAGMHTLLARQTSSKLALGFAGHLFASGAVRSRIQFIAQGTKVLGISPGRVAAIKIDYPKDKEEQQKIAATLSSLDDLITAQSRQLEALTAHKRGLMQVLFPAEGETVPKLRFPEFQDAGEWETDILTGSGVATFVNAKSSVQELPLTFYVSTENLLPDYGGAIPATNLPTSGSFTQFKKGDVLVSNIRPYLKKVWQAEVSGAASNDVIVIRAGSKVSASFLSFLLKNDRFIDYVMKGAEGVKMPRGDKEEIRKYALAFPTRAEQQKIVAILSSLDELLAAQRARLAALQRHKKGLMQGLFPAAA